MSATEGNEKLQFFHEFIERWKESVAKEFAKAGEFPIVAAIVITRSISEVWTMPTWASEYMILYTHSDYCRQYPDQLQDEEAEKDRFAETVLRMMVQGRAKAFVITAEAYRKELDRKELDRTQVVIDDARIDPADPGAQEVVTITYEHELLGGVSACTANILREGETARLASFTNEHNVQREGRFAGLLWRAHQDPRF